MTGVMIRELSKQYAEKNEVDIGRFLSAIQVFHEVVDEEYNMTGDCCIELFSDGSGTVIGPIRFGSKRLFSFTGLPQLVQKADELMEKYGIVWVD